MNSIHTEEKDNIKDVLCYYTDCNTQFILEQFRAQVWTFFDKNPVLHKLPVPVIHSLKSRIKDPEHLKDKIIRKQNKGIMITKENLFDEITDLIGVRILHLYQDQFCVIHQAIMEKVRKD